MNSRKVEICGVNTGNLKVLSEKSKINLIKMAKSGDKKSREKLIECNLKLVLSVVQKFSNRTDSLDDIFQVGTIGLIKAIDNFDLSQNTRFSTYAVPMIIGEIRRYLRDNTSIHVSRSMREIAYKSIQAKEEIFCETGREPTVSEISKKLGVSKETISISLESIIDPVSLDEPVFSGEDESVCLVEQIQSNEDEDWVDEILIKDQIKKLSDKEKLILSLRFLKGLTQTKVAKKLNISQAQVSRIEKNAIRKIKNKKSD